MRLSCFTDHKQIEILHDTIRIEEVKADESPPPDLDTLIAKLRYDSPLSVDQYVNIDEDNQIEEEVSDESLMKAAELNDGLADAPPPEPEDDLDGEETNCDATCSSNEVKQQKRVPHHASIESCNTLIAYCIEEECAADKLDWLIGLHAKAHQKNEDSKKQVSLTKFFTNHRQTTIKHTDNFLIFSIPFSGATIKR